MYNVQCTQYGGHGGGGAKVKMKVNQLILAYSVTARYVPARTPVIG